MTLLTPALGMTLFACLAVPLLALYILRLRRTRRTVSSTVAWASRTEDLRANAPFQRLRANLLLFLQLLVLLALGVAVAQPVLQGWGRTEGRVVLLIDVSASMSTLDGPGGCSRLEQARALASARARAMQGGGLFGGRVPEIMVVAFAQSPQVVLPFSASLGRVEAAIASVQPTDERTLVEPALELVRAHRTPIGEQGTPEPPPSIELFSDGRLLDADTAPLRGSEALTYWRCGRLDTPNAGFSAAGSDPGARDPALRTLFAGLRNFATEPAERRVEVRSGDAMVAATAGPVVLPARGDEGSAMPGSRRVVLNGPGAAGSLALSSVPGDAFGVDDRAWVVQRERRPLRLAMLGSDPSLEALLEALEPDRLDRVTLDQVQALQQSDPAWAEAFDAVISVGSPPPSMERGRWLHFGPPPTVRGLNAFGDPGRDFAVSARGDHPALRQCNLNEVLVSKAHRVAVSAPWEPLVEGRSGALVMAGPTACGYAIVVAFEPGDSNWPFQRSFVNFTAQSLELLAGLGNLADLPSLAPGDMLSLRVSDGITQVTVEGPEGRAEPLAVRDGEVSWGPIRRVGTYRVRWPGPRGQMVERWVVVNQFDQGECDVAAVETLELAGSEAFSGGVQMTTMELWPWLVGASLVLLTWEWWLHHRRTVPRTARGLSSTP
jgi:Ca-activated chloride channel family protein